jgi:membrane-associated phospholipid phosphatase
VERFREAGVVVVGLIVCTLVVWLTDLDRKVAAALFTPVSGPATDWMKWQGQVDPFWDAVYRFTPVPSLLLGSLALGALVLAPFRQRLRPWWRPALFVLLLLALGPGLLVNLVLKDNIAKPRPYELIEFGGAYAHTEFWEPGKNRQPQTEQQVKQNDNGSFPSGHAAMAFAVMAPWFVLRRRRRGVAVSFLVAGIAWGLMVGGARMYQGGHFFSDVVWAGGLVYLVGWLLAIVLALDRWPAADPQLPPPAS